MVCKLLSQSEPLGRKEKTQLEDCPRKFFLTRPFVLFRPAISTQQLFRREFHGILVSWAVISGNLV